MENIIFYYFSLLITTILKYLSNNDLLSKSNLHKSATIIQANYRGYRSRKKYLPLVLYKMKNHLLNSGFKCSQKFRDGRKNSIVDEVDIINRLSSKFKIIKSTPNMWHDFTVYDNYFGHIPVNIKTTTTKSNDTIGCMAICVYAFTNVPMTLNTRYANVEMSKLLIESFKNKKYGNRDYYFLVVNKETGKIILNSIRGLEEIVPNIINLPFQVRWD